MLLIRQATPDDLFTLHAIGIATYRAHFSHLWQQPEEMDAFLAKDFAVPALENTLQNPRTCWLLAYQDDTPVGYARVNHGSRMGEGDIVGAELQKIYFLPECAGQGYGKQLFQHVQDEAVEQRQAALWLEVLKRNPSAIRFYQRNGLTIQGETQIASAQGAIELWYMAKKL